MSLTNPNKVITEQRLAEFYSQILPYLGGMPEAIANKFDKANLYSTDEKIVGCWTDGRPLYQTTIEYTSISFSSSWATLDNTTFASSMDMLVKSDVINIDANGSIYPLNDIQIRLNNGVLQKKYSSSVTIPKMYIIYQYTKTTDQANSFNIGSDTDYSTDEKIIGTWIDGKPLYQKTIDCGALPNNTTKNTAHGISNIGEIISIIGTTKRTASGSWTEPIPRITPAGSNQCNITVDSTNISIQSTVNLGTNYAGPTYITIQYTKTTD